MTFKELKPKLVGESLKIFICYPTYELLKKKGYKIYDPEEKTEFDDYEVGVMSDDDIHTIYLMGK